jgi:hypothetical protein
MITIPIDKFNINKFWEKTPTPLKYILVFVLFLSVSYFLISKNIQDTSVKELDSMKVGIQATYTLIDNFEKFKSQQTAYNEEVLKYIHELHDLVQELNSNTNRKLDIIINAGSNNTQDIIEKLMLLNESFDKLSKVYQKNVEDKVPENLSPTYQPQITVKKVDSLPMRPGVKK